MTILGYLYWFWIEWFWMIAAMVVITVWRRHGRRLRRGVIHRYLFRHWGLFGPLWAQMFLISWLVVGLGFYITGPQEVARVITALYWTIDLAWTLIDYITGGDDPGKRLRKLSEALKKKFALAPRQRPVIDFG